ncbi:choline dehydrogenase-like flavoprotein [Bradyrhizobium sp. LM3.6]
MTDTFDFVVVGAGSGGCTVAGRLSEDAGTSVALLDAGGPNDNWRITTPFGLALPYKAANWAFDTVPQKGLNGRIGYQPRGKGLGGSSAMNAMVYIRGNKWDYDHWGLARQCRLVVRGRAALFQALGEQHRFRRRVSWQGRPAACQQAALGQSDP